MFGIGLVTIDNRFYDDLGDKWWDPRGPLGTLHDLNPARFGYFERVARSLDGVRVLEVGCGGGILAESFARAGSLITGVDLSEPSLRVARRHSRSNNLVIDFAAARGESLPFADSSFDVVVSADFLEHVSDLDQVVGECARALKPGGLFLYDTINRTLRARVIAVWLLERVLGLIPPNTHDANMFIKPAELEAIMARHGIENRETRGLEPESGPVGALLSFIKTGRLGAFKISGGTSISYVGYGVKIEEDVGPF